MIPGELEPVRLPAIGRPEPLEQLAEARRRAVDAGGALVSAFHLLDRAIADAGERGVAVTVRFDDAIIETAWQAYRTGGTLPWERARR